MSHRYSQHKGSYHQFTCYVVQVWHKVADSKFLTQNLTVRRQPEDIWRRAAEIEASHDEDNLAPPSIEELVVVKPKTGRLKALGDADCDIIFAACTVDKKAQFIFQQDNAPSHSSQLTLQVRKKQIFHSLSI